MTVTEEAQDLNLCNVCQENTALGKMGRGKMRSLCIECAVEMRDNGDCPVCRGVGVVADKGLEHIAECNGKLPREPKPRKKKAKTATEMGKDHDAAARAADRRESDGASDTVFGGVKNVRDMDLNELQARLNGSWVKVHSSTSRNPRKLDILEIVTLNGDEVEFVDAKTRGVRTFDRSKIVKLGPNRK